MANWRLWDNISTIHFLNMAFYRSDLEEGLIGIDKLRPGYVDKLSDCKNIETSIYLRIVSKTISLIRPHGTPA